MCPDEPRPDDVARYEALAEKAYDEMYDPRSPAACYNDLKYYFVRAVGAAERAGMKADAERLSMRLEHCMQVYRSQFG